MIAEQGKACPHCAATMERGEREFDRSGNLLPPSWACPDCCHWEWFETGTDGRGLTAKEIAYNDDDRN